MDIILTYISNIIKGGVSSIYKRLATSNSPRSENFDPRVEPSELLYIDANNLYGYAMSKKLPHNQFRWMSEHELKCLDPLQYQESSQYGMILEVDLLYPTYLYESHKDQPLAPENINITEDMLPDWMCDIYKTHGVKFSEQTRLAPNFFDKEKHVLHIANLKFYIEQGLTLKCIRRGIIFHHSTWLKPYILMNTEKRMAATSEFERSFFKLLINSVYGKCLENVRNYKDIRMVSTEKFASKYVSKCQYKSFIIIDKDLVCLELKKTKVLLCKPVSVGMTILDLSKRHMFRFHYLVMKPSFPRSEICFMDTDSFLYHIFGSDLHSKLSELSEFFDFSNYKEDDPLFSSANRSTPGRFKDEMKGGIITQFCGLRAKCYSIICDNEQKLAAAGVKSSMQKYLKHHKFLETLKNSSIQFISQKTIRSQHHTLYTQRQTRIALSAIDIKRYCLNDGIQTVPHGYFRCKRD